MTNVVSGKKRFVLGVEAMVSIITAWQFFLPT